MHHTFRIFTFLLVAMAASPASAEPESFESAVQPFFKKYCLRCHNAQKQKGEFRLDTLPRDFGDELIA